ncbi:unnamed protein product, partial [Rotaria magnacalcarata]
MSTKPSKKTQGASLYSMFIDAYMKARPNEKRDVKLHDGQAEWSEIKCNEEYVKEKIEEYLEIYNEFCAASKQHLERSTSPRPVKKRKINSCRQGKKNQNENEANQENSENGEEEEECDIFVNFNDEDEDDDDDDGQDEKRKKKNNKKKSSISKKKKPTDKELMEDINNLSSLAGFALKPLEKDKRQPA